MANKKTSKKQAASDSRVGEIADQLEQAFLAGLGALSDAQKKGVERFDTLVEKGEEFRSLAATKTESLIDDVQGAIRDMTGDAQTRALKG